MRNALVTVIDRFCTGLVSPCHRLHVWPLLPNCLTKRIVKNLQIGCSGFPVSNVFSNPMLCCSSIRNDESYRTFCVLGSRVSHKAGFGMQRLSPGRDCAVDFALNVSSRRRQWLEYEDAVESLDLGRALELLDAINTFESDRDISSDTPVHDNSELTAVRDLPLLQAKSGQAAVYLKVLDACQATLDLNMVGKAYDWLQDRGFLPNFGKCMAQDINSERLITPDMMMAQVGLDASKLSPKKWGLSGNSAIAAIVLFGVVSAFVHNDIDVRPIVALLLGLGFYDAIKLGGTGAVQILSLYQPYRRRVLVHEAGHVLVAYLLGCPVRGVVLDAMEAMTMEIPGQAGTQFWDGTLEKELQENRLTNASIDRYCTVLFAGIAAEGLVFGEAEGGENDENLYKSVISQLQPPWSPGKISNQARWAVLQAFQLLKEHKKAHDAVVNALEQGLPLGALVLIIEQTLA